MTSYAAWPVNDAYLRSTVAALSASVPVGATITATRPTRSPSAAPTVATTIRSANCSGIHHLILNFLKRFLKMASFQYRLHSANEHHDEVLRPLR